MFDKHEFYGSTTVGERGQIVLPAKIRDDFNINVGDKLLVIGIGTPDKQSVLIMKAKVLDDIIKSMSQHFQKMQEIKDIIELESDND